MKKYNKNSAFLHLDKQTMLFQLDRNPPARASQAGPEGKWTVPPWKKQRNNLQIYKRNIWKSESFRNIKIRQDKQVQVNSSCRIMKHVCTM